MNKQIATAVQATLSGAMTLLLTNSAAMASGFSVPELSALGAGMANAVVANPEQTGAFAYNPSAMGFHDGSSVALGTLLINPKFEVTSASGHHSSREADWFAAPAFQLALKVHEQWRLGIGVGAPFGLETRWPFGTFPKLSGSHPTSSKLEIITVTPALAYRVNNDLSLSLGLDYYNLREGKIDTQLTKLEGDGDALGWNAGLLYRHDAWSLGASFHSSATIDVDGWYTPLDPTLVQLGILPPSQGASLDLNLPWRLQLGVRYEVTDALAVELDWTRTGWSEFDRIDVSSDRNGSLSSEVNDWHDANAFRLGITYDIRPTTQLRLGYSYDQTGQNENHFTPRIPDNDRHLFAIGIGQDLGQGWALEGAYLYAKVDERRIRNHRPYQPGGEAIGSDAFNGDYESNVNLVAIEVRKTF